jgi:hypothetical protein
MHWSCPCPDAQRWIQHCTIPHRKASRIAATIAAYEAILAGHAGKLSKGEKGVVLCASPTKSQSKVVRDYVRSVFEVPLLANELANENSSGFELKSGIRVEILAGDWRRIESPKRWYP